jgi:class 3 adenylate cyclase
MWDGASRHLARHRRTDRAILEGLPIALFEDGPAPGDEAPAALSHSAELKLEAASGERRVQPVAAVVTLIGGALVAVLPAWQSATTLALLSWTVIAASYFALAALRPAPPSLRRDAIAVALEVSLASGPILVLALLEAPGLVAGGAGVGGYYAALVLAALRLRPRLPLLAVGLAAVQHVVIYLALIRPEIGARGDGLLVERLAWLAVACAGVALSTGALRRLAGRSLGERQVRQHLESTLGRYVSRDVAEAILRDGVAPAPQRRTVTVLFCDLRGFTFLCERERPEDVVELLNVFYEGACATVEASGGTVNKLLGDGLLALFGAPIDHPEHADAAADTALAIMALVAELRERGGVWTHLAVGIGIDTGEVVLGPIGSRARAEYTAIGSPVNRAARLQSLAERENRRIIMSQAARRALTRKHRVVSLGQVALKGFAAPERAFYLAGASASGGHPAARTRRDNDLRAAASRALATAGLAELTPTPMETTMPEAEPTGETQQISLRLDPTIDRHAVAAALTQSGEITRLDPLGPEGVARPGDGLTPPPQAADEETGRRDLRRPRR